MKLVIVLLLVGVVLFLLLRRSSGGAGAGRRLERRSAEQGKRPPGAEPYRAVAVTCATSACAAAKAVAGKRYLLGTAPQLPLANCDKGSCRCRYAHFADRRTEDGERRIPFSLQSSLYTSAGESERRQRRGRRSKDFAEA